ncbi:hypothetical protein SADUNF_Sadunf19G0040300 [Salix dunnii]|uniref:Leucine-rich repeat-containing N-terminal plant-type domain-containing protein n=1 Tax=Salix dunnii TaxID=1413687 RepID=A0A835MCG4_9ROSI|nr:hypothetical protein SADUNF_Sadunf19G0040300 [Salix dunnii]
MKFLCLDLKWKTQKKTKQQPLGSPLYFVKNERGDERFSKQKAKWGALIGKIKDASLCNKITGNIPNGPQMDRLDNLSSYANNRSVEKESPKKKPTECGEMVFMENGMDWISFWICLNSFSDVFVCVELITSRSNRDWLLRFQCNELLSFFESRKVRKTIPSTHSSILESWNSSSDCCQWKYLTFTSVTSSVLTPLFRLHAHLSLSFSLNHIQVEIPRGGLANLTKLGTPRFGRHQFGLHVLKNNFSGQFPYNIDEAPRLRILELRENNFWGSIPQSIHNLLHLVVLDISTNGFSSHKFPNVNQDSPLVYVNLSSNRLPGEIPLNFSVRTQVLVPSRNELLDFVLLRRT